MLTLLNALVLGHNITKLEFGKRLCVLKCYLKWVETPFGTPFTMPQTPTTYLTVFTLGCD